MVVEKQLALLVVSVAGGDGAFVHDVAVASIGRVVDGVTLLYDVRHHSSVFVVFAYGEPYVAPQAGTINLVPCIAVEVSLAADPIGIDVGLLGLVGETEQVGFRSVGMHLYGVFEHVHLGVGEEVHQVLSQRVGAQLIVGVYEGDVFSLCYVEAFVACSAESLVVLMDGTDHVVALLQLVAEHSASVCGTIVNEQYLTIIRQLRYDGLYAALEKLLHIIYGYDNAQGHSATRYSLQIYGKTSEMYETCFNILRRVKYIRSLGHKYTTICDFNQGFRGITDKKVYLCAFSEDIRLDRYVKQEQNSETVKNSGYDGILKYTGIFGGVQGLVSIITMVKVAIVSKLLGPIGVGLVDVYNRSIELVKKTTDLGISYSAVQSISEQRDADNASSGVMHYAVKVVRSWSLWLAMMGTLLFFFLSPLLSRWSFEGDEAYTNMFRMLSLAVGCSSLMGGELAVLKGARMLGRVAWFQLLSAVVMLAVAVPCYFFWGFAGIVPSLLLTAVGLLAVACWHSFRAFPYRVALFSKRIIADGVYIIRHGFNYTLAGFLNSGAYYLVTIYVLDKANAGDVGCYSYGNLLVSYLSMLVFATLDSDFFPRLSAVNKNKVRSNVLVNTQIEMLVVLITPMIVAFAVCLPLVPRWVFDTSFMPLVDMAQWAVVGLFFKALMLPPAYLSLSKGESSVFLLQEVLSYTVMAAAMIFGFRYMGMVGLGLGILVSGVFDWLSVWTIALLRYGFHYSRRVWRLCFAQMPMLAIMLVIVRLTDGWVYALAGAAVAFVSVVFSLRFLHRHTDFLRRFSKS